MRFIHRWFVVGCAFGGWSCAQSSTACEAGTAACANHSVVVAELGKDVVLSVGKAVDIDDARVRLEFERVVADSRCPRDVQCVWAGNATARLRVSAGATPQALELNTNVGVKEGRFDGYVLRFVALTPDPVSTAGIDPSAYRLTVRLERP